MDLLRECRVDCSDGIPIRIVLPEKRTTRLAKDLFRDAMFVQNHRIVCGTVAVTMEDEDLVEIEAAVPNLVRLGSLWPDALLVAGLDGYDRPQMFELDRFRRPQPGHFHRDAGGQVAPMADALFVDWVGPVGHDPKPARWVKLRGYRWWPCYACIRYGDDWQRMTFVEKLGDRPASWQERNVEARPSATLDFCSNLARLTTGKTTPRFRAAVEQTCLLFEPPIESPWAPSALSALSALASRPSKRARPLD
jgi:hypothetical protein